MCSPLTDSRCARPARRIASASRSLIAPSSPVASAAAMPPRLPPSRSVICAVRRRRRLPSAAPGDTSSTGANPRPVAPIPANHAARAKSYAPGTDAAAGGISRARSRIRAASPSPFGTSSVARLTRTRGGSPIPGSLWIVSRTRSRATSASIPTTRPVTTATTGRASTGAATCSARHHAVATPAAIRTPPTATLCAARPPRPIAAAAQAMASAASIAAIHWFGSGIRNQPPAPVPNATGTHKAIRSRSACSHASTRSRNRCHPWGI